MTRKRLLNILAILVCVVLALHLTASALDLYWRFLWLDNVAHFLGGASSSLLVLWLFFFSGYVKFSLPSGFRLCLVMVGGALVIGIGWEIFERAAGLLISPEGYWLDTGLDLLSDTLGALTAYISIRKYL